MQGVQTLAGQAGVAQRQRAAAAVAEHMNRGEVLERGQHLGNLGHAIPMCVEHDHQGLGGRPGVQCGDLGKQSLIVFDRRIDDDEALGSGLRRNVSGQRILRRIGP